MHLQYLFRNLYRCPCLFSLLWKSSSGGLYFCMMPMLLYLDVLTYLQHCLFSFIMFRPSILRTHDTHVSAIFNVGFIWVYEFWSLPTKYKHWVLVKSPWFVLLLLQKLVDIFSPSYSATVLLLIFGYVMLACFFTCFNSSSLLTDNGFFVADPCDSAHRAVSRSLLFRMSCSFSVLPFHIQPC